MFRKIIAVALLATGILNQSFAGTSTTGYEKRIYISSPHQKQALKVDFQPAKSAFAVNEAIKFKLKSNKRVFLFLFNINFATNEAVMILPNHLQPANRNMYSSGQLFTVPNKNIEFFSDRAGSERIVVIASTKYPREISLKQYKQAGNFYLSSAKAVASQLKNIQLREAQIRSTNKEEVYIKEFDLPIYAQNTPPNYALPLPTHPQPSIIIPSALVQTQPNLVLSSHAMPVISFITTDRSRYRQGETAKIGYGADQNGWMNIYIKSERSNYRLLAELPVIANRMVYTNGQAKEKGKHTLMAIFSKKKGYRLKSSDFKSEKGFFVRFTKPKLSNRKIIQTEYIVD